MNSTLKKITSEAKRIKKLHPNKHSKWTDYVKEASKKIKPVKSAKKISGYKKGKTNFVEVGEKKKPGKNVRVIRRSKAGKKGTFRDFVSIDGIQSDMQKKLKSALDFKATFLSNIEYAKKMMTVEKDKKNYWKVELKIYRDKLKKVNSLITKLKKSL